METVEDVLKQCQWLVSKGRRSEQAKLLLPRVAAVRRVVNKEKRTRVVFECDPNTFSAFHAQLKRYRELVVNIPIAQQIMVELLAAVKDETILALAEEQEASDFEMGKDSHEGE